MHRVFASGPRVLAGLWVVGAVLTLRAEAAPVSESAAARAATPAQKLRKELDRVITIDIDQQPLPLALNQLQEQTQINFVLDRASLTAAEVDPDQLVVRLKLKDVKVRSALRALLTPYNLGYAILDDKVFVSQEEVVVLKQMRQHVNVSFEKTAFARALRQLARDTATNLVLDPRLQKNGEMPVTLELEDVQLEAAVRLMAEIVDLRPVRVGNTLFVTNKASAAELRQDSDTAEKEEGIPNLREVLRRRLDKIAVPAPNPPPAPKTDDKKEEKKEDKQDKQQKQDKDDPERIP